MVKSLAKQFEELDIKNQEAITNIINDYKVNYTIGKQETIDKINQKTVLKIKSLKGFRSFLKYLNAERTPEIELKFKQYINKKQTEDGINLDKNNKTLDFYIEKIKNDNMLEVLMYKYTIENITFKEMWKFLEEYFSLSLSEKMVYKILFKLEIKKTKEQANNSRRKYCIDNDLANLGNNNIPERVNNRLKNLGFNDIEDLAKFYNNNVKYTYKLLADKLNENVASNDYVFTERWMDKHISKYTPKTKSRLEESVKEFFLENIGKDKIVFNTRTIFPTPSQRELDIYIPSMKIAFEINGDYWHSDKFMLLNNGSTAVNYHNNKREECKKLGIELFFIWEKDWNNHNVLIKKEIVEILQGKKSKNKMLYKLYSSYNNLPIKKEIEKIFKNYIKEKNVFKFGTIVDYLLENGTYIKINGYNDDPYNVAVKALKDDENLLQFYEWDNLNNVLNLIKGKILPLNKISAHKLIAKTITFKEQKDFLQDNHFQGSVRKSGNDVFYGLFKEKELIAVASFAKPRFNKKYDYEFIRYAVDSQYIIYGGVNKLFQKFIKENQPDNIISYIDFNHTTKQHTFLNSLGFEEIKRNGTRKVFYRVEDNKLIDRGSLMRKGADTLLKTNYGSIEECGLNNIEIMYKENFSLYKTAGTRTFIYENKKEKK